MDDDPDLATIAPLLADECARTILEATVDERLSAEALAERCDVSTPTIYRRLESLQDAGLVTVEQRPEADGHHFKVYSATLDQVVVDLGSAGFDVRLSRRDRMADRFTRFVEDLR